MKQAETQTAAATSTVTARVPETYQWLLVPVQLDPRAEVTWEASRLPGQDALAARASKKRKSDELLIGSFAATRLRMELDRVPLWRGEHVSVRQLAEDFARYLYLPRLKDSDVLLAAIRDGAALLTWESDSFGFADSYDEVVSRYWGLRVQTNVSLMDASSTTLVVKPTAARRQLDAEAPTPPVVVVPPGPPDHGGSTGGGTVTPPVWPPPVPPVVSTQSKRFHGSVVLETTRVGRDAGRIADEVIAHLAALIGANVRVTLDIEADIPSGAPDGVIRTVTENSRTLRFTSQGFEKE